MVFKTIAENVQSFFQKEEALEQEPKKAPDAAMELFEKPIAKDHDVIAHHLPKQQMKQQKPVVKPKLPFSSEELKAQLPEQSTSVVRQPVATTSPEPEVNTEEDISSAIAEFEEAINEVPGEDGSTVPISEPIQPATQPVIPRGDGYFDQLAERLRQQGYNEETLQGALTSMKEHHAQRAALAEQRFHNEERERTLSQKLIELQRLEREWASKRDQVSASENRMAELEGAISAKTSELKDIVSTMREMPQLPEPTVTQTSSSNLSPSHPIPQPAYPVKTKTVVPFFLSNGTELSSLSALREALMGMSDATFYHHVTPNRNDFSTWIREGLGNPELANRILHVSSKYEMAKFLE